MRMSKCLRFLTLIPKWFIHAFQLSRIGVSLWVETLVKNFLPFCLSG